MLLPSEFGARIELDRERIVALASRFGHQKSSVGLDSLGLRLDLWLFGVLDRVENPVGSNGVVLLLAGFLKGSSGLSEAEGLRSRRTVQVLARVESTDGGNVSQVGQLEEVVLLLAKGAHATLVVGIEVAVVTLVSEVSVVVPVALALMVSVVSTVAAVDSDSLRHRRESDALWEVGKRIDESSLLVVAVVEGAVLAKLALSVLGPVLTRDRLVV